MPDSTLILIAEDSLTQAERLRYVLERHGFRVVTASNGRRALEAVQKEKPALVISDIVMPEMDGYALCKALKSNPASADVPVILVTTLVDPQDVIRAIECRADNFVTKPYQEPVLLAQIESLLENAGRPPEGASEEGDTILFHGQRHVISTDRRQILGLLLSTYEAAIQRNQELAQARDELRDANVALEAVNKELEAFSYSVSHDLRAPLRAIRGFNQALREEHASQLDPAGNELLSRVQAACERMGQLIDDLLELAKVARSELHREPVDLSAMARSVVGELRANEPGRQVQVRIDDGLVASGDARLLQIVLENLFSNAWKFTSRVPEAVIEFTAQPAGQHREFVIRDNGVGFDMARVDMLFGVFQRFHSASEFPGTGVGLATVLRIIQRHGGRIWGNSAPGQGASFYFIL